MNFHFVIWWKAIFIEFAILFLLIILIDVYMVAKHKSTTKKYYSGNLKGLDKELKRLQFISNIFSLNPRNRNREAIFNTTCILLASIYLLDGNENGFLKELSKVKSEQRCELKQFMLALFLKSKNDIKNAKMCYEKFKLCEHNYENINVVMQYLFSDEDTVKNEELTNAINNFKNPAIIKLISEVM